MRRDELGRRMEFDDGDGDDDVARRMIMRGGAASLNAWVVLPTPPPSNNIAEKDDARRANGVFLLIMAGSMFMVCLVYEKPLWRRHEVVHGELGTTNRSRCEIT